MTLPSPLRIEPIAGYSPTIGRLVGMLTYARSTTLATVEELTVAQLDHFERTVSPAPKINAHWTWFHVAEHEINHRGQIRWLRARAP